MLNYLFKTSDLDSYKCDIRCEMSKIDQSGVQCERPTSNSRLRYADAIKSAYHNLPAVNNTEFHHPYLSYGYR